MKPFFILDTNKPFDETCSDLKSVITAHDFGLVAVLDLAATLRSKNIGFVENCRVFEVCNPQQAAKLLQLDMSLSMVLPCRISIYTESGQTKIGMPKPVDMLRDLCGFPEVNDITQKVDSGLTAGILDAASSA